MKNGSIKKRPNFREKSEETFIVHERKILLFSNKNVIQIFLLLNINILINKLICVYIIPRVDIFYL